MSVLTSHPGIGRAEPASLNIRTVKGIDAPAVAQLRARCTTGAPPSPGFTERMRTWLGAEGEPRLTLLATLEEQAVGLISMLEHRGLPEPGVPRSRWGYIGHLFVVEERRGEGVATALISETIRIADHRLYERLLVCPGNTAVALFHRMGFQMSDEASPNQMLLSRPLPCP